jgi:hypothetical protein
LRKPAASGILSLLLLLLLLLLSCLRRLPLLLLLSCLRHLLLLRILVAAARAASPAGGLAAAGLPPGQQGCLRSS